MKTGLIKERWFRVVAVKVGLVIGGLGGLLAALLVHVIYLHLELRRNRKDAIEAQRIVGSLRTYADHWFAVAAARQRAGPLPKEDEADGD